MDLYILAMTKFLLSFIDVTTVSEFAWMFLLANILNNCFSHVRKYTTQEGKSMRPWIHLSCQHRVFCKGKKSLIKVSRSWAIRLVDFSSGGLSAL